MNEEILSMCSEFYNISEQELEDMEAQEQANEDYYERYNY